MRANEVSTGDLMSSRQPSNLVKNTRFTSHACNIFWWTIKEKKRGLIYEEMKCFFFNFLSSVPETFEWILPLLDSTGNSTGNFTAFRILPKFTPEKFGIPARQNLVWSVIFFCANSDIYQRYLWYLYSMFKKYSYQFYIATYNMNYFTIV